MRIHADPDPQPWKMKVVHLDVGIRSGQVQLWLGTGHGGWNGNNKKVHVQGRCKGLNMEEVENHSKHMYLLVYISDWAENLHTGYLL